MSRLFFRRFSIKPWMCIPFHQKKSELILASHGYPTTARHQIGRSLKCGRLRGLGLVYLPHYTIYPGTTFPIRISRFFMLEMFLFWLSLSFSLFPSFMPFCFTLFTFEQTFIMRFIHVIILSGLASLSIGSGVIPGNWSVQLMADLRPEKLSEAKWNEAVDVMITQSEGFVDRSSLSTTSSR